MKETSSRHSVAFSAAGRNTGSGWNRIILTLAIAGLAWSAGCGGDAETGFPSRPIDVVTHASPGGGTDTTTRMMLVGTHQALGIDMAVLPKTGGGGVVAMNYVDRQPRDGYTVLGITPTHLFAMARGQGPFNIEDLLPIARATDDPIVVTVNAESGIRSLAELIELGRKRPIKWGTTLAGSVDHVAGATLARSANMQLSVVPFSGGGEIVTNLMGSNIDAAGLNLTEALDQIQRGVFRALAVMAEQRMDAIPEVPTTVELGYDVVFSTVRGFVVLRGTPEDRVRILERAMIEGLRHPAYQEYLAGSGLSPGSVTGSEAWGRQLGRLYRQAVTAMAELGMTSR